MGQEGWAGRKGEVRVDSIGIRGVGRRQEGHARVEGVG